MFEANERKLFVGKDRESKEELREIFKEAQIV